MRRGSSPAATGSPQQLLGNAVRHHQAGHLDAAYRLYDKLVKADPANADALHLKGLVLHQRGDHAGARPLIEAAIAVRPTNAAYFNSLGTVLLELGDPGAAEKSLRHAERLDPTLAEVHNNLGNALQQLGQLSDAQRCYARSLKIRPNYAEAHFNAGRAAHAAGDLAGAIDHYERAVALRPTYGKALRGLGDARAEQGHAIEAEAWYRKALDVEPRDAETLAAVAALWERENRLDDPLAKAEKAIRFNAQNIRAIVIAARCERRLGRPEAGLRRLDGCNLETFDAAARAFAAFEKGAILDRLGDYADAFDAYVEANRLSAQSPEAERIDRTRHPKQIVALKERFTPAWVSGWTANVPGAEQSPVFLIGFPRSGTTLLDQILDSHPALTTLEEKPTIDRVKQEVAALPGGYPDALATMTPDTVKRLRDVYFQEVAAALGNAPAGRIVDKMPLNTMDVGMIHRLFPDAPMLLALRHPCDVVLSGFMQAFKPNAAMVQFDSLAGTASFYAQVMGLWRQYADVLPLRILTTRYEDLVADFAAETQRILAFLGLPWDDAVLAYQERAKSRIIATPSYHQVVQPIYRRSIGRWRNYRAALAPVLPLLQPFVEAFDYALDDSPES